MAQVSKQALDKKIQKDIEQQLQHMVTRSIKQIPGTIIEELLTETERLMFAKRLATICLLAKEYSYYRIQQLLGVSISTSKRLHSLLIGGDFETIEKMVIRSTEREAVNQMIEGILRAGLPPNRYVLKKRKG